MNWLVTAILGVVMMAVTVEGQVTVSPQTLDNLNTAYRSECNAAHRCAAFGRQATAEGLDYAASLFRAAYKAETTHRERHKRTILSLGGRVKDFKLDAVKVGTTSDNLRSVLKGEVYERNVMYPGFLAVAKRDGAKEAVRTFLYAQKAAAELISLYDRALNKPSRNTDPVFYVCKICGYTKTELRTANCPSCRESVRRYERVR